MLLVSHSFVPTLSLKKNQLLQMNLDKHQVNFYGWKVHVTYHHVVISDDIPI